MKRIAFFICVCAGLLFSCQSKDKGVTTDLIDIPESASSEKVSSDLPKISFEKEVYDFGRLTQGEKVSYSFKFTNTGKKNLIITGVKATCGCTVPTFPQGIIKSGESEYISVTFDSSGKHGIQNQVVTISSNAQPSLTYLTVRAEVISL